MFFFKFYRFYVILNLQVYRKRFFLQKKAPAGKCTHGKKIFYGFVLFPGKGIFTYYQFSHLTTIFFIGENSYFSYTIFFSHHSRVLSNHSRVLSNYNRVLSNHSRVLSNHNKVLLKHNRVLLKHNRVLLKHNRILLKHKKAKIRGKWSDSSS